MRSRRSFAGALLELLLIVLIALGLAFLVQAFIVKPYRIPSPSMVPTLRIGERVLVSRLTLHVSSLRVGEIVVFHPPVDYESCANPDQGDGGVPGGGQPCDVAQRTASTQTFIKRLVGLPGDRIQIIDGHVYRNGVREKDGYIAPCQGQSDCNFPRPIIVPPDQYYMMGDNRPDSEDSRFWGPVRASWIIGTAFFSYWPPDRIGTL